MKRDDEADFGPIAEWLRSERPPFDEQDSAAMRRAVWREIEARRLPERAFRLGRLLLGGGALVAVALVAVLWLRPSEVPFVTPPAFDRVPQIAAEGAYPGRRNVDDFPRPSSEPSHSLSAPRPSSRAGARPGAAPLGDVPVKIEFQTANPNVRIIWLVKKGEAAPKASRTEEVS